MLGKLIKYDLKSVNKVLIVFYILSIFFGLLTRIFLSIEDSFICEIIGKICSGTAIAMMVNILINNLIGVWRRFTCNLYGDESYLTHTLPVTKNELYISKFITAFGSFFLSFIVIVLTLFIAYYSKENLDVVKNLILPVAKIYDSSVLAILLWFIFICFLEILNIVQAGYFGLIAGHMKNSNKMGWSVIFGFIGYMVLQILLIIILFIFALFNKDIMNLFYTSEIINVETIKLLILYGIIGYTTTLIIAFITSIKLFNKGVNVD